MLARFILMIAVAIAVAACSFGGEIDKPGEGPSVRTLVADAAFAQLPKEQRCNIAREVGGGNLDVANAAIVSVLQQAKADQTEVNPMIVRRLDHLAITMRMTIEKCGATLPHFEEIMALVKTVGDPASDKRTIDLDAERERLVREFLAPK